MLKINKFLEITITELIKKNANFYEMKTISMLNLSIFRLIKNETGRAILRVIAGPRAFKVVLFARLTPIPFGLQNTIFGVIKLKLEFFIKLK